MSSVTRLMQSLIESHGGPRYRPYSPETQQVLKRMRGAGESIRKLREAQAMYKQRALESSQREDWANPDAMAEWEELSAEAARLKKEADTHPSGLVEVLQAAVNEYGMPNRAKGILRKDAARKMLRNRRR